MSGPQSTPSVEAQMGQQAHQNIQVRRQMADWFQSYRAHSTSKEYDVTITSKPASTEDKICLTVYENKEVVPLTVKNSGVQTVYLTFRPFNLMMNTFTVRDCHGDIIEAITQHALGPGEAYELEVHFYADHAGFYEHLLFFRFQTCEESLDKFEIMRLLEVMRRTSCNEEHLPTAANSLFNHQTVKWAPNDSFYCPGVAVTLQNDEIPLKTYGMPNSMKDLRISVGKLQRESLDWKNYSERFHLLLHLEEFQLKTEIEKCNQEGVTIFRDRWNENIHILQIPSFSRNSHAWLSGSMVLVTPVNQVGGNACLEGRVCHMDAERIYVKFQESFPRNFREDTKFKVSFCINRICLRIQHRAAELVYKYRLKEVLFPREECSSPRVHLHRMSELANNLEQRQAVQHIVARSAKPAPYLVFGPPGTGKTVTLVEAIRQIVKTQASSNILVCAPSNSATDDICEKILGAQIDEHEVFRLYALSYPVKNIPPIIQPCCNLDLETNTFQIPTKKDLMAYKIVVTTLITAGRIVTRGIPQGHYTYIFVDEAGQARETECIIPISGLLNPQTCQLVLAGDPKQLGPIVTSRIAEEHGLGLSLLERLMTCNDMYKSSETWGFNKSFVTKLLKNYRSHHAILKIPNELFYEGKLQPCAHVKESLYNNWELLPNKGFPLIFHGVAGTDEREANSTSVYNTAEVDVLKEYLKSLIDHLHKKGVHKIEPTEIGIIAPYRKHVEKIQSALQMDKDLRRENLENVVVDTVERLQGKEFSVILVSTVRSFPKLTAQNQLFTLGFLNQKRFNVAMTRAQDLLIVVGDPRILKIDPIWSKFIHYCSKEGAYRGITVSDAEEKEHTRTVVRSPTQREESCSNSWSLLDEPTHPSLAPLFTIK